MTQINGKTVLVTGANRGIGEKYVHALIKAGAAKVYAGARNPDSLKSLVEDYEGKVVAVKLDVTNAAEISAAARDLSDTQILINNAGVAGFEGIISTADDSAARSEMEVNYFAVFDMVRAFSPVLKANGGGAIVNMSSIVGHTAFPNIGSYSASKAAVHSLTQAVRAELAAQGTAVFGVYPGPVDTDMGEELDMDKTSPEDVANAVLQSIEAGEEDIFPDAMSRDLHQQILGDPKAVEKYVAQFLPA